jgi:phosphoribosylformylglycinamidine synthase
LKFFHGVTRGTPPWIDLKMEQAVQNCCREAIERGLLRSAHDVSDGGLVVALAEGCIGGPDKPLGLRIETLEMNRGDAFLFSESQSRVIVSLTENRLGELQEIAARFNVPLHVIGAVGGSRFVIQPLLRLPVEDLRAAWVSGLTERLK